MRKRYSGIYAIETRAGAYIGATIDLDTRRGAQATKLRTGKHPSKRLQEAFDAEGGATWRVLDYCDERDLHFREKHWMDVYEGALLKSAPQVSYGGGMLPERRAMINAGLGLTNVAPSDTFGGTRRLTATLTSREPNTETAT